MTKNARLEDIADWIHANHAPLYGIPVGKGICEYFPCVWARELAKELDTLLAKSATGGKGD